MASRNSENLFEKLQPVLGLPDNCKTVKIIMEVDSVVSVICEYYPDVKSLETVLVEYELVKKDG